jgi:hypothetical protein
MKMREICVDSTLDNTQQPSLFFKAKGTDRRPLLVGLHTMHETVNLVHFIKTCLKIVFIDKFYKQ